MKLIGIKEKAGQVLGISKELNLCYVITTTLKLY
jgi:hypothetical protein